MHTDDPFDALDPLRPRPTAPPPPPVPEVSVIHKIVWWFGLLVLAGGHCALFEELRQFPRGRDGGEPLVFWVFGFAILVGAGLVANPLARIPRRDPWRSAEELDALRSAAANDGISRGTLAYVLALGVAVPLSAVLLAVPSFAAGFALCLAPPLVAALTCVVVARRAPPPAVAPEPDVPEVAPEVAPEGASDRYLPLDRGGRPIAAWREAVRALLTRAHDYRTDGVTRDDLLRLLEDPRTPVERRVAAAMALAAEDDPVTTVRVHAAATSPDARVRIALERGLDGTLADDELDAAQAADRREA